MTDLIKIMVSKQTYFFLYSFSIYFTFAHTTNGTNWKNYENQISYEAKIQIECNDERYTKEHIFQCDNGACIPKNYTCDGVDHCWDGSDEWIPTCKNTVENTRKKRAADRHCAVPLPSPDKTIEYDCHVDNADSKSCLVNGLIRENTLATIVCNTGYTTINETQIRSVCNRKQWIPPIDKCHKLCKTLTPENVDLKCYRENREISCDKNSLIAGARVQPTCKFLHTFKTGIAAEYKEIICQEDGNWNEILFKCTPECGVQYTGPKKLLVANGRNETFGDSPWHVAVYDRKKLLICGGTIIHPLLILSAAHCFYDSSAKGNFNEDDYEIVVSKFSRNYYAPDNPYQKAFKIKKILVSDKGYSDLADFHTADIVILVLKEKITLSPTVLPACIDPIHIREYPPEGTLAKVSGWGYNENDALLEPLHTADLPFISRKRCIEMVPKDFRPYVTFDKFCAGSETGAGVLQGDSGGGLLFQQGNFYYIRGIVSIKDSNVTRIAAFTDLDAHIDWIMAVRNEMEKEIAQNNSASLEGTTPANAPSKPTTASTISRDACAVSASYLDKTLNYKCAKGKPTQSCIKNDGTEVSEFTKATFTCKPGYLLVDNGTLNYACINGSWIPELPRCEKICDQLNPINVDLVCYRNNVIINCKGPLIFGDDVRPACKPLHSPTNPIAIRERLLCQEDGKWDNVLFKCKPNCGILANPTDSDIIQWSSNGTSFTETYNRLSWHVSIYDIPTKKFVCNGVIIHTSLILSAASCFYDEKNRSQMNASNYEVLVSKVTSNYKFLDNRNQRSYKIKEIRYPTAQLTKENFPTNDIALLIVERKIMVKKSVLPACLDTNQLKFEPTVQTQGKVHTIEIGINYVSNTTCLSTAPADFKQFITQNTFCANLVDDDRSYLPTISGSGWVLRDGNNYYLKGIAGRKHRDTGIVIYTKVANYIDWILKVREEVEKNTAS